MYNFCAPSYRQILQEDINIAWDKRLVMLEGGDDQVIVHFADGSQVTADFVVGWDGAGKDGSMAGTNNSLP